ncbi:Hypothetical protein CINCED_3A007700 [Cinara cedri]|uniref:Uncharacterized protein n=1 Tax=Cinara cedri TaxID=506608 RepID=A0A5E4N7Z8_9HEMI|nr:Hypothetical protein CINCED_3A007700 [Cinara cedri]
MSFNFNEHGRTFTDNNGNNSLIDFNNMDDGPELSPEMEAQCQALSDSITAKDILFSLHHFYFKYVLTLL